MIIIITDIRAVSGGEEAEISLEIQNLEHCQAVKGRVSAQMLAELGLSSRLGQSFPIDRMTCEAILRSINLQTAIKKGITLLSYARHTKKSLKNKLLGKGVPCELAEEAVCFLAAHGYIREETDALLLAEQLAEKKLYGKNRVKKELFTKGFSADVMRETMDALETDFTEICAKRIRKMGGIALFTEKTVKQKTMAALMRYGFTYEDIRTALSCLQDEGAD